MTSKQVIFAIIILFNIFPNKMSSQDIMQFDNKLLIDDIQTISYEKYDTINGICINLLARDKYINGLGLSFIFTNCITNGMSISFYHRFEVFKGVNICPFERGSNLYGINLSIYNKTSYLTGLSISLINRSISEIKGVQFGLININSGRGFSCMCPGRLKGLQFGIFNKTDKNNGIQIGVINSTYSENGIQIGILNIRPNNPKLFKHLPILNLNLEKYKKQIQYK